MKTCASCKQEKVSDNFDKNKTTKDGLHSECKLCKKEYNKNRYLLDKEKIKQQAQKYRKENFDYYREYNKEYRNKNLERMREYSFRYYSDEDNKNHKRQMDKVYRQVHKKQIRRIQREWENERYKTNIQYRLTCIIRKRFICALKGNFKSGSAVADLMMSISNFKFYLEERFYPHPITGEAMTWENYGKKWEIDHIKALCLFDLTDRKQFLEAVHYSNLRPLWKEDHYKKTGNDIRLLKEAQ